VALADGAGGSFSGLGEFTTAALELNTNALEGSLLLLAPLFSFNIPRED
jgi:hypothetical protein